MAHLDDRQITRVVLRPVASPLPLGLLAVAVGTFTVAGLQLSWIPAANSADVGLLLLTFVVPLQALSSIFGFLARDPAASTGMALQAGGWFSIGAALHRAPPGKASPALGLLLLAVATTLLVPVVVASFGKLLASAVMALTALRFYLTAAAQLSPVRGWQTAAAVVGLCLGVAALYAGLAFELEDSMHKTVLPTLRWRQGRTAVSGDLTDEISGVEHEAGVRRKL